ncbi:MAG: lamin tail domain-containing protein, partial [Bacteroidota bacterium]
DNALAANWGSSILEGGSPGASNSRLCQTNLLPIRFNEVNYHYETDPNSLDAGDWVELYNPMGTSRDISNWEFWVEDSLFVIPSGTSVPGNGYHLLLRDQVDFLQSHPGIGNFSGSFGFPLPNDAARLLLKDIQGCTNALLYYTDQDPWPTQADGDGETLILSQPNQNLTQPTSWRASGGIAGTPGVINQITNCQPAPLVINEIYYRGPSNPNPGDWIELYNPTALIQDLSGWEIHAGNSFYRFPQGISIGPFGYLVIVENQISFSALYPWLANPIGDMGFGLDGDGEFVALFSAERCLVDELRYNDSPPWPQAPDGLGPSLALIDPGLDNQLPGSWAASNQGGAPFGTPGSANNIPAPCQGLSMDETGIVINEIAYNSPAGYDAGNWLELYNPAVSSVDLSGWELHEADSGYVFPPGTIIPAQGYLLIAELPTDLQVITSGLGVDILGPTGFGFSNNGETLLLYSSTSCLIDSVSYDDRAPWPIEPDGRGPSLSLRDYTLDNALGQSWERSPGAGTPGQGNNTDPCSILGEIVINEIHYQSAPSTDAGDWLELYNAGTGTIDLSGWILQDERNSYVIPSGTNLAAGEYLVLVEDTAAFETQHLTIPYLGPIGFKLNNGGEEIRLLQDDYCEVDQVIYDNVAPWPPAAAGQGPSLMLIAPELDNRLPSNWVANTPKGTPGQDNSFACEPALALNGPALWLRAGEGILSNGDSVYQWNDQSGNAKHVLQSNLSQQPTLIDDDTLRFNGYPFLFFDGADDLLLFDNTLLNNTNYTLYGVVERTTNHQNYFLGTLKSTKNKGLHLGLRSNTRATAAQYANDVDVNVPSYNSDGGTTPEIISARLDQVGKSIRLIRNGQEYLASHSNTAQMYDTGQGVVGGGYSSQRWDGYIAEILIYQRPLDEFEQRILDTYLNLRYGVPLAVDYHLYYSFANYPEMIAGIGNSPAQCLEQRQARSTSRGSVFSLRNPSNLDPGEFLFWGHNDEGVNEIVVTESPAYTHRLDQQWRMSVIGEPGLVDVYFDLEGTGIDLTDTTAFSLIIDQSGGDMNNLRKHITGLEIIDDQVWFRNVDFAHGDVFTLATQSTGCGAQQVESWTAQLSCDPLLVGRDTTIFSLSNGCDSLAIVETNLRPADTTYLDFPVCDPSLQGTSQLLFGNQFGCDSVVI